MHEMKKWNSKHQQLDQADKRTRELEDRDFKIIQEEKNKEIRMKKASVIYGKPSEKPICRSLEFQKEKRERESRKFI